MRSRRVVEYGFREHKLSVLGDDGANIAEQLYRAVVSPIVNDVLHEVKISPRRDRLEKVAGDGLAPVREAILSDRSLCCGN